MAGSEHSRQDEFARVDVAGEGQGTAEWSHEAHDLAPEGSAGRSDSEATESGGARDDTPLPARRLRSLDALRGFDMFWIIGGAELIHAITARFPNRWLTWLSEQTAGHPEWHGFRFWDLIFPLFLFISGATLPFSFGRRLEQGDSRGRLARVALRRGLVLVLLGAIYNGLLAFPPLEQIRFPSVLGRIGLAWMFAAWIFLCCGTGARILWSASLLLGYWAAMLWIPGPDGQAGVWTMEGNLASWIDRSLIPGRLHRGIHDPEGLVSTIPAIATALMGALAGQWLRKPRLWGVVNTIGLLAVGAGFVWLGERWGEHFPLNKNLWTSSFALYTAGWSLLLLGAFYFVIDVCRLGFLFYPFVVIGLNPLTIYLVQRKLVDFELPVNFLFGGALEYVREAERAIAFLALVLLAKWLLLLFLHRKRTYLRV